MSAATFSFGSLTRLASAPMRRSIWSDRKKVTQGAVHFDVVEKLTSAACRLRTRGRPVDVAASPSREDR